MSVTPSREGDANSLPLGIGKLTAQVFRCLTPDLAGITWNTDGRAHRDGQVRSDDQNAIEPLHTGHDDSRVAPMYPLAVVY